MTGFVARLKVLLVLFRPVWVFNAWLWLTLSAIRLAMIPIDGVTDKELMLGLSVFDAAVSAFYFWLVKKTEEWKK